MYVGLLPDSNESRPVRQEPDMHDRGETECLRELWTTNDDIGTERNGKIPPQRSLVRLILE